MTLIKLLWEQWHEHQCSIAAREVKQAVVVTSEEYQETTRMLQRRADSIKAQIEKEESKP